MIYFTSDSHFSHRNIILGTSQWEDKSKCRPFNTIEEHDINLIDNINTVILPNDRLIHIGDWSFGGINNVKKFREMINCNNIELIYGNHDHHIENDENLQKLFTRCDYLRTIYIDKQMIVLCHYALQVWENNHRSSFMLHGHSHQNLNHDNDGKILDVSPEGHNFTPWSMDEINIYMADRKVVAKDHH